MKLKLFLLFLPFGLTISLHSQVKAKDIFEKYGIYDDLNVLIREDKSTATLSQTISWIEEKLNNYYIRSYQTNHKLSTLTGEETISEDVDVIDYNVSIKGGRINIRIKKQVFKSTTEVSLSTMLPKTVKRQYIDEDNISFKVSDLKNIGWLLDQLSIEYYDSGSKGGISTYYIRMLADREPDLKKRIVKSFAHLYNLSSTIKKDVF